MKIKRCNMFLEKADAIVITTNGDVKRDGGAVMGRGVALQAARSWYGLQKVLGKKLQNKGNRVRLLTKDDAAVPYLHLPRKNDALLVAVPWHIISFPVKHHWMDKADPELIEKSCKQLSKLISKKDWKRILLPKPGCGNGNLSWKKEVRKIVKSYFGKSDKVVIVTES